MFGSISSNEFHSSDVYSLIYFISIYTHWSGYAHHNLIIITIYWDLDLHIVTYYVSPILQVSEPKFRFYKEDNADAFE